MKKIIYLLSFLILESNFLYAQKFDSKYVQITTSQVGGYTISMMKLSRKVNHIKVKYFATNENGVSVAERFNQWSRGKNIICYSAGGYFGGNYLPVGLCIDNGKIVNNNVEKNRLDALAIIYPTGAFAVSDLKQKNINIDIKNPLGLQKFKNWAQSNKASVFQTHLLCFNNDLKVSPTSSGSSINAASRRFLAVCQDKQGAIHHLILNIKESITIYDATKVAHEYILNANSEFNKIAFMINLEKGMQDVFEYYDGIGNLSTTKYFGGGTPLTDAQNLIVYYYE